MKQEYRRLHPAFEELIEALRQGFHRYDSVEEFETHLRSRAPKLIETLGARAAMELLFDASVIGVRLGNAGRRVSNVRTVIWPFPPAAGFTFIKAFTRV